jgi:lipopolysaccharide export system permease protein
MNLFEEINFFKDIDIGIYLPVLLTSLKVPSLLHNMLPFIVLISGIWFFLKIKKNDEITAMKVSGMSNLSVIIIPGIISVLLGIIFVTFINPITSISLKKYEMIKGEYERDKDYLAAITKNGIWIKDKNNIIRASNLNNENLMDLTIYEFDKDNNFVKRIEADSANIISRNWLLKNVKIRDQDGNLLSDNLDQIIYKSRYNLDKIKSLYSNIDTISFWKIRNEIKLLKERVYSTKQMETRMHRSLSFPFFLLAMIFLSGVFTLGTRIKENNLTYVFITIIICILVYFFNDFSAALGKTERLSVEIAVWKPIIIIFIFSAVGMIYANQK